MNLKHHGWTPVRERFRPISLMKLLTSALGSSASLFLSSSEEHSRRHVHLCAIPVGAHAAAFLHIYFRIQGMLWNIQIRILILRASALCVDR